MDDFFNEARAAMPVASLPERRQSARRVLRAEAHFQPAGRPPVRVRTLELSKLALGVVCPVNLLPQLSGRVRFVLPQRQRGATTVELEAWVRHCIYSRSEDGFKVALGFREVAGDMARLIDSFLAG